MLKIWGRYKALFSCFGIITASCLIYACGYLLNLIWKVNLVYVAIVSLGVSLLIGILVDEPKSVFICILSSLILGTVLVTFILLRPVISYEPYKFDIALTVTISYLVKIGLFNIITSFIGALLGISLSGKW